MLGRVIGKPGDLVSVIDAKAIVNGKQLNESYVENQPSVCRVKDFNEKIVPKNHFFILGDNRCNSVDSRIFGFIKADKLIGKVFYIWMSNDNDRVGKI